MGLSPADTTTETPAKQVYCPGFEFTVLAQNCPG